MTLKRMAYALMLNAWLASLGNWLWLVGFLQKPEESLLEARWAYSGSALFAGLCLYGMALDLRNK